MIYIVDLESVETRYTCEWKTHVPKLLKGEKLEYTIIDGVDDIPEATTPGAFLNFGGTNVYKAAQIQKIGRLFCEGAVKDGDHFLFTDAWHPGVINVKYMAELLGIKVKLHGLWHAGSYDPQDFLGRLIGDKPWVRHAEKSFYDCFDHNYFATDFHIAMFMMNLFEMKTVRGADFNGKVVRTGWPMEYISKLKKLRKVEKENIVLFPHRIAPEKQPEIFRDLAKEFPDYEFIICQEKKLTKDEYHELLGKAKMVFSCSLQETLGISVPEGMMAGALGMVPNRLSYSEMYDVEQMYPSEWTKNWATYQHNKSKLVSTIRERLDNYETQREYGDKSIERIHKDFFSFDNAIKMLK